MIRASWEWVRSILIAFVLFLLVRSFIVEAFRIPTASMESTLLVGDFLLVNKAAYGAQIPGTHLRIPSIFEPDRGEVVVFNPPHDPSRNYVKRVVGLPGDTVEMRGKVLYRNRKPVEEPYVRYLNRHPDVVHPGMKWQEDYLVDRGEAHSYRPSRDHWGPLVVPDEKYFVLGDNRDDSEDSRHWGFVDRAAIRGRPWLIYYSFDPGLDEPLPWLRFVRWSRIGGVVR